MPVAMLRMLVSRSRVLLGLLVLSVGVVVSRLVVMMSGSVMVRGCLMVMLNGRVLGVLWSSSPGEVWGDKSAS
jgi:hypothetical protein